LKIIFALFTFLLISQISFAQLKIKKDNRSCLYGLVDSNSTWIVPPTYSMMKKSFYIKGYFFVEDVVEEGVLNDKGEIVVPVIYDDVSEKYRCKYFFIEKNDQHGLIKKDGQILIEPTYEFIDCFKDLICYGQNKKYGLMTTDLVKIIEPQKYKIHDWVGFKGSNYSIRRANPAAQQHYLYGILSKTGEVLLKPNYDSPFSFTRYKLDNNKQDDKHGIVDDNGKIVVPFEYDNIEKPYYQKHFILRQNNKLSMASVENGEILTVQAYDSIGEFNNNNVARVVLDQKCGLIDKEGRELISPKYSSMEEFYAHTKRNRLSEINSICEENGKFGILNDKGEIEVPFENDWLGWPDPLTRLDVFFMKNDSLRLLNIESGKISSPEAYFEKDEKVREFEINGKFGIISRTGYIEADFIFDKITQNPNGDWFGHREGEGFCTLTIYRTFVSKSGYYDEIRPAVTNEETGKTYFPVVRDGKYGAINGKGGTEISIYYDDLLLPPRTYIDTKGKEGQITWSYKADKGKWKIGSFSPNHKSYSKLHYDYPVKINLNGYNILSRDLLVGICDSALNIIVPFEYESIIQHNDSLFWMNEKMKWGLYNINKPKTPIFKYNKLIMLNGHAMLTTDDGQDVYDPAGKIVKEDASLKETFNPKKGRLVDFTDSRQYHPYSKLKYQYHEVDNQFVALLDEHDSNDVKINNYMLNQLFRKNYIPFYELQGHPVYQKIHFTGYRGGTEAKCFELRDYFTDGGSILRAALTKWERYHKIKRFYLKKSNSRIYRYNYRKRPSREICDVPNKKDYRLEYIALGKTPVTATILKSDDKSVIHNYRTDGETFKKIKFAELFIEGFEASLSAMCFDELDKFDSFEMDCMKQDALVTSKTDKFILHKDSIQIFFLNTARRSWDQPILLPYTQLKELLRPDTWIQKMTGKLD